MVPSSALKAACTPRPSACAHAHTHTHITRTWQAPSHLSKPSSDVTSLTLAWQPTAPCPVVPLNLVRLG